MRCAILNPGPSIAHTLPAEHMLLYDRVWAVNRAIAFGAHFWAALDWQMLDQIPHRPWLTIITLRQSKAKMEGCWSGRWELTEAVPEIGGPHNFSFLCALCHALTLKPTSIDIYGADWTNAPDWDNRHTSSGRNDGRWDKERAQFHVIQVHAAQQGCPITRIKEQRHGD